MKCFDIFRRLDHGLVFAFSVTAIEKRRAEQAWRAPRLQSLWIDFALGLRQQQCDARFALAHACHVNQLEAAHDILGNAAACVLRGVRDGGWQACSELDFHFEYNVHTCGLTSLRGTLHVGSNPTLTPPRCSTKLGQDHEDAHNRRRHHHRTNNRH